MKRLEILKFWPLVAFVATYLILAVFSFKSYGISWDEQNVYSRAVNLYTYLFTKNVDPLISYPIVFRANPDDVNVFYNNVYGLIQYIFNKNQTFEIYHLLNFFFCTFLFVAAYWLLYKQTKKSLLSLLGPVFILLTPRFFGDIANNPKDMPFAVVYFISLLGIYLLRDTKNLLLKALVLGLLFGLAQSMRIVGFTVYFIFVMFELYHAYLHSQIKNMKDLLRYAGNQSLIVGLIFIVSNFLMVITWPYVGGNYFKHLLQLFVVSARFPQDREILFMGQQVLQTHLPWFYMTVWFLIATPLFILFFAIASIFFIKNKRHNEAFVLFSLAIFFNIAVYLITKPEVYNGLRHYLFMIPIITTVAALSCIDFLKHSSSKFLKYGIIFLVSVNILIVSLTMIKLHPYEYIYFNELVGGVKGAQDQFEMDYWAKSNREAALWLNQNITEKDAKVYVCGNAFSAAYYFSKNIKTSADSQHADYVICHTWGSEYQTIRGQVIHTVERDGVLLNLVFKLQ